MTTSSPAVSFSCRNSFFCLLCLWLAVHFILRVATSQTFQHDEAEQPIFAQALAWGYSGQPPLYTWLVWLVGQVFGINVFSLALLKTLILGGIYSFLFLGAARVTDDRRAACAIGSLLLVPLFAWEFLRDYTHSPLACAVSAVTFYVVVCLVQTGRTRHYVALGLCCGLGMLAKYNYALFPAAMLLAGLTVPNFRGRLLDRRLLLSLAIAAVIFAPHAMWLREHWPLVADFLGTRASVGSGETYWHGVVQGTGSLAWNIFLFLTPWWVWCLAFFPRGVFARRDERGPGVHQAFLARFLLASLLLLWGLVLVGRVTHFHVHWLEPLLILLPVFFFGRLGHIDWNSVRLRRFGMVIAGSAVIVVGLRVGQAWFGLQAGKFGDRDRLLAAQAQVLRESGFSTGLLVSDNHMVAGNLSRFFPDAQVWCLRYAPTEDPRDRPGQDVCCIVFDATYFDGPPDPLVHLLTERLGITLSATTPYTFVAISDTPHRHTSRLGYVVLPLRKDPGGHAYSRLPIPPP